MKPHLNKMMAALKLPPSVVGSEAALAAGLTGDYVQLLPAFLHMLRELKAQGRSFTLIFRTFGEDLGKVEKELNAFCEGRHPLFPDDEWRMDGSDGMPDYRLSLQQGDKEGCATFFRDPQNEVLVVVRGTIRQPDEIKEGVEYFDQFTDVEVVEGHDAVFKLYDTFAAKRRSLALRDFFPGWASVAQKPHGGKPFFLGSLNDDASHRIFFDDHITAVNPKIVDPIDTQHWPKRYTCAQVYGVHLVRALPFESILNKNWFMERIRDCEVNRSMRIERWKLAQELLGDPSVVQQVLEALARPDDRMQVLHRSSLVEQPEFHPWNASNLVVKASHVPTFEEG
jgi:hypothetical protein